METTTALKHRLQDVLDVLQLQEGATAETEEFARRLLARARVEFLDSRPPEWTAARVLELYETLGETSPADITVRVRTLPERPDEFAVQTVMRDRAFIVDTLREYLHGEGYVVDQLLHPVLRVAFDEEEGGLRFLDRGAERGESLSVTFIVVEGEPDAGELTRLERAIAERLEKVREATDDFQPMVRQCDEIAGNLEVLKERFPWRAAEIGEIQQFLRWLQEGNFVFLGYRGYEIAESGDDGGRMVRVEPGSGLGILREEEDSRFAGARPLDELPAGLRARVLGGPLMIFSKTNAESPVHRRARMDYVGVKRLDEDGKVRGEWRFLGLLTARAYSQDASRIPILRRKLREILEAEGCVPGSHDYSVIHRIFNSMPKEELFVASVPELLQAIGTVMEAEGGDEIRLSSRVDPLGRGVNVMVILPAPKFSGEVRRKIQADLVETYRGELLNYHLAIGGGDQARLHFYLASDLEDIDRVDVSALEERIRSTARTWQERLADALEDRYEPERARELVGRHQGEFSAEYITTVEVQTAVEDIGHLDALQRSGLPQLVLEEVEPGRPDLTRLKIFAPRGELVLSDVMPVLENLGLRVLEADRYDVGKPGPTPATIHTYEVETPARWDVDREEAEGRVAEAFHAVRAGRAEDDRLNSLVLSARLGWWEVALLRAYANYAFRIGAVTSRAGVRRPLVEYPGSARQLFEVFAAHHRPGEMQDRETRVRDRTQAFLDSLQDVRGIDDDRALRQLLNLVQATVRTNFYQSRNRERGDGSVALKFACDRLESMVLPRPEYEVYVNNARTEGAHLRMGAVARGGIRWSDRTEDFRVEVLGLVKTQQVKNAVIVPEGAKGAFVVKRPPDDPESRGEAGVASYREFIRALLDVTDNVVDGRVVHPPETRVRDGDDPYLVVAADKGTATLSDTANELAAEYGFWLGDAFASGGSHGYDHKKLGITARGAWECVRRHFREMGRDLSSETFTVVGIGDMSGDVFGNGMLLSDSIRLLAAFDHRHVFLDPDPDPERSFEERRRLFELPSSTWDDYDRDVISDGGGVFSREAKEVPLSVPVREWLGVDAEAMHGDELIRAMLRAPVDLLWNGGIGTYVKASFESHAEVGDPANDATRVDADELGARVVGEGGNLGLTQPARIEYALGGGRVNTDALDNSAGVDMSDHEVNLKILLAAEVGAGAMSVDERNDLLRRVEGEVADAVLRDNYLQSLAVSLEEHRTRDRPGEFRETLISLERLGVLDRELEALPTTEALAERQEEGRYLTRPELAVLMAYTKLYLEDELTASPLCGRDGPTELLFGYFPDAAVEAVGRSRVEGHRLAGRIVATSLANLFVNRMGASAIVQLARETGRRAPEIVGAWYAAYRIGESEALYRRIEALDDSVPAGVQNRWYLEISGVLEDATRWLLAETGLTGEPEETVERYGEGVAELREALPELVTEAQREEMASRRSLFEVDGADPGLASRLVSFTRLDALLPVALLARDHGLPARVVGRVYFGLARDLDFGWLQEKLDRVAGADVWEQRAAKKLSLRLEEARTKITARILEEVESGQDAEDALRAFRRRHEKGLRRIREVVADVRGTAEEPGLPALMVAVDTVSARAGGPGPGVDADATVS